MPTYQYRCTECASELEVVQRFTDDPLTVCPECEGSLRKVYSAVGVVFKGSGFYATDSRGASKANAANAADSKTDHKSAASESKPSAEAKSSSEAKTSSTASTAA